MTSVSNKLCTSLRQKPSQRKPALSRRQCPRLHLELLEDRLVPTHFVADFNPAPIQSPDYQVNSYQQDSQYSPDVASDSQGNHVVVWTSKGQDEISEPDGMGVYLQRYDADGAPLEAADFLVNTTTKGQQKHPAIAMADDGRFAVVWYADQKEGFQDVRGIYGRRFSADGTPIGDEIRIAVFTEAIASQPDIAMDADGDFVVTWKYDPNNQWVDDTDIHAQRFDKDGNTLGFMFVTPEQQGAEFDQWSPAISMADDGTFVIAWTSRNEDGQGDGVYARIYDANGTPLEGQLQVNTVAMGGQYMPSVAMDSDGDFVIAWNSYTTSPLEVHARRYFKDPSLNRWTAGNEFRVHEQTSTNSSVYYHPSVGMGDDGDFVIAWIHAQDNDTNIYAREYSGEIILPQTGPNGDLGQEFRVNNVTTGLRQNPVVTMDDDSDFVIAWRGNGRIFNPRTSQFEGDERGIFLKRYYENESPNLSIPNQTVGEGQLLRFYLFDGDPDVPVQSITYSLEEASPGAYISYIPGVPWPQFRWTPGEGAAGTYEVMIRVTDDGSPSLSDTETFTITVTDNVQPPVLAAIDDQSLIRGEEPLKVEFNASDPEGDVLDFAAEAVAYDPLYALDQDLLLTQKNGTYHENWMGRQDKWLWSSKESQWYYLLPSGNMYKWLNSSAVADPLVATVDAAVWSNPAMLYEAQAPAGPVPVTLRVEGNELFVYPSDQYAGTFKVHVSVSDGIHIDEGSFLVSVENNAPEFPAFQDQELSHNDTLDLNITAYDANGDEIEYAAAVFVENPLYDLDQSLGLDFTGDYWENWLGLSEKWLMGNEGWYYFTPDGDLYHYGSGVLLEQVGSEVWHNPALLFDAQELTKAPEDVTVSIDKSDPNNVKLSFDPAGLPGDYVMAIAADDGIDSTTQSLHVEVTNRAPAFVHPLEFTDRKVTSGERVVVDITAVDVDGDDIVYSAAVSMRNPLYETAQDLGLYFTGRYWENWLGLNEKWLMGNEGWYYLTPEGNLYRYQGNSFVESVGSEAWADPSKLYDAQQWIAAPDGVSVSIDDSDPNTVQLTFQPNSHEGQFEFAVWAGDGIESTSRRFRVTSI